MDHPPKSNTKPQNSSGSKLLNPKRAAQSFHKHGKPKAIVNRERHRETSGLRKSNAGARSLNHIGFGCQKRHQLHAMSTTATIKHHGLVLRSLIQTHSIISLCFLAQLVVINVSKALCQNSFYSGPVSFSQFEHLGNRLETQTKMNPLPATNTNELLPQQSTTNRHLELRNTTATNPLQLPEGPFLVFSENEKLDRPQVSMRVNATTSQKPPPSVRENMDLTKGDSKRNSSLQHTLPRIHKRNKLRFSPLSSDNNSSIKRTVNPAETADELDKQRMAFRHKFTFMVNGKEFPLNPPAAPTTAAGEFSSSALIANELPDNITKNLEFGGGSKKVNRFGDSMNSAADYESGFDVNGDSEAPAASQSHSREKHPLLDPPDDTTRSNGRRPAIGGIQSAPSSSSSSLMSSSSSSRSSAAIAADNNDEEEDGDDNDEPQSATPVSSADLEDNASSGTKSRASRNQAKRGSTSGNVISDWSKPGGVKQQSSGNTNFYEQHFPIKSKSYAAGSSRFSTLLSGGGSDSNDSGNQSGEQQANKHWDTKYSSSATFSNSMNNPNSLAGQSKASSSLAETSVASHDNESGYSKASNKKNPYPKAPVSAKSRYTSSPAPSQSPTSSLSNGTKSRTGARGDGEPSLNNEQNTTIGDKAIANSNDKHSSFLNSPQRPGGDGAMVPISGTQHLMRSARFDRSPSNETKGFINSQSNPKSNYNPFDGPQHPLSITEYKTNSSSDFSFAPMMAQQKMADGSDLDVPQKVATAAVLTPKAPIVQRDLSYRPQPFATSASSIFQQPFGPVAGTFNQDLMAAYSAIGRPGVGPMFDRITNSRAILHKDSSVSNNNNNNNNKPRGVSHQQPFLEVNRSATEKMSSIVRTGPIMPYPLANHHHHHQLRALVPAAVALLAQAQEEQQVRAANQLRALLAVQQTPVPSIIHNDHFVHPRASYPPIAPPPTSQNLSSEQMIATSNHLGVSHLGPQAHMSPGESNSYNSMASIHDYPDRPLMGGGPSNGGDPNPNGDSPLSPSTLSATTMSNILSDDQRPPGAGNDYQNEGSSYEPTSSSPMRGSSHNSDRATSGSDQITNSRSSMSDVYFRPEHKSRESGSSSGGGSSGSYPSRNVVDPYEDVSTGISASEYERDLADMDEEFNRATYRRPPPVNQITGESYITMSPDRYEGRRYQRPRPSYNDFTGTDYISAAGSVSNMLPRNYHQRNPISWSSSPTYSDNTELWTDTSTDYSPLGSYLSPSHYSLRWKPRYQRAYSAAAAPYLAAAASEQHHMQPAYNFIPSHFSHSAMPTETVSIALSPLAAAAAAAASALAAADKTRHQNNGWLTLPRVATSSLAPAVSASNAHATTLPAAIQAAYYHHHARPNPYALSSVPIYAIAPRPTPPLAAAASAAAPSIIPYYHSAAPAIFAYRPTGALPTQLLTAASFAYPLRLPMGPMPRPSPMSLGPTRSISLRPFYSDLQFAESKSKSNLTNHSSDNHTKGLSKTGGSLSAMAKNLTRKMFGSASQMRPQHVAPPNPLYDLFAQTQNSTSNLSPQIVL